MGEELPVCNDGIVTSSFGVKYPPVVDQPVFFLDYDGTLAPIVAEPMEAFPHPDLQEILSQLAAAYPTWIVTGRDLHALGILLPVRLPAVGLHGIEWGEVGAVAEERIERAAIYGALPAQEKQRYHRLIAQWLGARPESDGEASIETIAQHYDRARCLDHAARGYVHAARLARARYANDRAVELFLKGLSYLNDTDMRLKMSAFSDLGALYDMSGEYDQALAYYREMRTLLQQGRPIGDLQ